MQRRTFLTASLGLALADQLPGQRAPKFNDNPFKLGVASGDPMPRGFVLWTRLISPSLSAPVPSSPIKVNWIVAKDDQCRNVVKRGSAIAAPELAHSVHVEVDGLAPNRDYWYRFSVGGEESPIGRTRTAPAFGNDLDRLTFAFASCQSYEDGLYTAHEHLAKENVELVVFLGDYIYENGPKAGASPRKHDAPEIFTLSDYRRRYELYKSDPFLQRSHAAAPWIVTWDDHEVDNDYAGDHQENNHPRDKFLERRASGYQAYYEHMPLRLAQKHSGSSLQLYRTVRYGKLAAFQVLDTRQYRDPQPCGGGGFTGACPDAASGDILGDTQTKWLLDALDKSWSKWNVMAQQVPFAKRVTVSGQPPNQSVGENMDKWGGYLASRRAVTEFLAKRKPENPVVITGDVHTNWAFDIHEDGDRGPILASEFVGTSISSSGDGSDRQPITDRLYSENPHLKFFNGQRGYVKCTVDAKVWRTEYRVVPYISKPGAPISTRETFVLESGRAGIHRA